jgi:hypothetical protein
VNNQNPIFMVPSINRKEWYALIMATLDPAITSRLFKIKLNILRRKVKRGMISTKNAVEELFKDCEKHYDLFRQDLELIFRRKKENINNP